MKKFLTLTGLLFLFTSACFGQDVIATRDAQKINAKVVEMNLDQIMFKYADNLDGLTYMFQKKDVISIHYENGRVELFQAANVSTASSLPYDVITTIDSQRINAQVIEVSMEQILFKYADNLNGSTYIFQKKDVNSIHYQNGRVELFQEAGAKTVQYNQNQPQNQYLNQNATANLPAFVPSGLTYNGGVMQDGIKLTPRRIREVMSGSRDALQMYNGGQIFGIAGFIFSNMGGYMVGWDLGTRIGGGKGNGTLLAVGAVSIGLGLGFSLIGDAKIKKSVMLYNAKQSGNLVSYQMNFGFTQTGLGLYMRF